MRSIRSPRAIRSRYDLTDESDVATVYNPTEMEQQEWAGM